MELVVVMVVTAILFVTTPSLVLQGVNTMVFLPRALATNYVATEAMHQMVEGGISSLPGHPLIQGLRFAAQAVPTGGNAIRPAIWLAESDRLGYLAGDGQYVLLRFDASTGQIMRSLPPSTATCNAVPVGLTEEALPADAMGGVQITATNPLFQYYNRVGILIAPSCPPSATIRRTDLSFVARTGAGVFQKGDASESLTSRVAIRAP